MRDELYGLALLGASMCAARPSPRLPAWTWEPKPSQMSQHCLAIRQEYEGSDALRTAVL